MALAAPFLIAGYPTGTPTVKTPPRDTSAGLGGLTFYQEWASQTAYPLSQGDDVGSGSGWAHPNALVDVCCLYDDTVGPDCQFRRTETNEVCPVDETLHTIKGWEDGAFISFDTTTLYYSYTQYDIAWFVGCEIPCTLGCVEIQCAVPTDCDEQSEIDAVLALCDVRCDAHCGRPVHWPLRDNVNLNSDLYETTIDETPDPDEWQEKATARTASADTSEGEKGASVNHDETEMAFARFVSLSGENLHTNVFLSTVSGGNWTSGTAVPDPSSGIPVNTICLEENPHIVEDETGTRLYFGSNRDPSRSTWTDQSAHRGPQHVRIWVAKRTGSTWSAAVEVDFPDLYAANGVGALVRKAPFVTALDPDEPTNDPRGRWIYWTGVEGDCTGTVGGQTVATPGCIYRAFQSSDLDYDDAWTGLGTNGRAELIAKPKAFLEAALGEVALITDVSLTHDGQWLYFAFGERERLPDDIEPPVDQSAIGELDDPTDGFDFLFGKWTVPAPLETDANWDVSGDTSGWEDSVNISPDGRTLYFAYSTWVLGQALWSRPGSDACTGCTKVEPWILVDETLKRPDDDTQTNIEKPGVSLYEATINTTNDNWDVSFAKFVNYSTYCEDDTSCGGTCENPCTLIDDACLNRDGPTSGAGCLTPDANGQNEGAVTVSVDGSGDRNLLFVRYGDFRPDDFTKSWRMYRSTDDCDANGENPGNGSTWCIPSLFTPVTIDDATASTALKKCSDNDPHLAANATSVYFDSNRGAETAGTCEKNLSKDFKIYHSRTTTSWSTPDEIRGFQDLTYPTCTSCADCPDVNACDAECPNSGTCTPGQDPGCCQPTEYCQVCQLVGTSLYRAKQPFVPEDEQEMYFLGDGPDCIPDGPADPNFPDDIATGSTGGCIYRARRDPTDANDPPKFIDPFLVAKPQPQGLPCQGTSAIDEGKIVGLGEPSMTKDGQLLYFLYLKKTLAGEPLPPCSGSQGVPCKCTSSDAPTGCTLPPCQLDDLYTGAPMHGSNCLYACDEERVEFNNNCSPWSELLCAEPTESQSSTQDGVDAYEFGIGNARKEFFDVSIGVVQAAQ